MKLAKIFMVSFFVLLIACGSSFNGVVDRPIMNDPKQIFTILDPIKYSKKKDYEDLIFKKILPAFEAYVDPSEEKNKLNKLALDGITVIVPESISEDSTWMFVTVCRPYIENANYSIWPGLEQMYGKEKAEKILNDWNDFHSRPQVLFWSKDYLNEVK